MWWDGNPLGEQNPLNNMGMKIRQGVWSSLTVWQLATLQGPLTQRSLTSHHSFKKDLFPIYNLNKHFSDLYKCRKWWSFCGKITVSIISSTDSFCRVGNGKAAERKARPAQAFSSTISYCQIHADLFAFQMATSLEPHILSFCMD